MRQLPPLNHLKAFEAAGRLGSFKAAASDLNVSEAAISQHIRSLEAYLGAPLFIRTYSGVLLTDAGADFVITLTGAFDSIDAASSKFKKSQLAGSLKVSVVPSLGSRWLIPRLEQFARFHPDIVVDPIVTPNVVRLGSDADIAIRHGNGAWRDADATLLMNEELTPVASATLLGKKRIKTPDELLDYPLLSAAARKLEWPHWFIAQGVGVSTELRYVTYDTVALAIDAAIAGVGICLIDKSLVREDLRQRRLKLVTGKVVSGINAYYVVLPKGSITDPKALAFKQWLIGEAKREAV